jgi:glycosyltransferase involved in cell wall biosynthesis
MAALRILHVTPSMDPRFGGLVPAVLQLLLADQEAGRATCLVTMGELDDEIRAKLPPENVRLFRPGVILGRLSGSARQVLWLVASVKRFDVVIAHSMFHVGTVVAGLAARCYGTQLVIRPHGSLDHYDVRKHERMKRMLVPLWRLLLGGHSEVWCTAERERRSLMTFGAAPETRVLQLSVDQPQVATRREPAPEVMQPGCTRRVVLFLGRIDPKKGLERLLAAWGQLPDLGAALLIVGRGADEYEAQISVLVDGNQGPNPVSLFGWADATARRELLMQASLFVLPSDNENFGIAAVEALLTGCPVLLSDGVYIADDLWRSGAAFRCGRDVDSLRTGIIDALADDDRRAAYAERGKRFAEVAYSQQGMADRYCSLLMDLMTSGRTPRRGE